MFTYRIHSDPKLRVKIILEESDARKMHLGDIIDLADNINRVSCWTNYFVSNLCQHGITFYWACYRP